MHKIQEKFYAKKSKKHGENGEKINTKSTSKDIIRRKTTKKMRIRKIERKIRRTT
ncbi:hypothetical protein [Melissococcus plutonius]|uniref:hypothetical protein n=1 Tax=Melissococcus plutonius TaxID=33970 RepID=UPI003C2CEE9C